MTKIGFLCYDTEYFTAEEGGRMIWAEYEWQRSIRLRTATEATLLTSRRRRSCPGYPRMIGNPDKSNIRRQGVHWARLVRGLRPREILGKETTNELWQTLSSPKLDPCSLTDRSRTFRFSEIKLSVGPLYFLLFEAWKSHDQYRIADEHAEP